MKLKNTKTNIPKSIQIKKVRDNFIFAHCTTCHSAQGSSIDGDISIFDYNHFDNRNYREWLWTAITRCRDTVDVDFMSLFNKKTGNITTNLNAQRVYNEYTHALDDVIPYCDKCNKS